MAVQVFRDCDILIAGYSVKSQHNEAAVELGHEERDPTVFGANSRLVKAGLKTGVINLSGFFEAGQTPERIDDILAQIVEGQEVSVWPDTFAEGKRGFGMIVSKSSHQPVGGAVGDLAPFNVGLTAAGEVQLMTSLQASTRTVTGNGSQFQLGTVAATQKIIGVLQVLAVSGTTPTLDVKIQSDTSGFASPIDRITFPQMTQAGINAFSVLSANGSFGSDDFWRATWTIGGTTPSFIFVVGLHIGAQ